MKQTLLVGNFGAQNLGDELILCAALKDYPAAWVMSAHAKLSQEFCETSFRAVCFSPTGFRSFGRYFFSKDYRLALKDLKGFEQIVFAGGGLFAIKLRACGLWFLVFWWLKRLNPTAEFRFEYQGIDTKMNFLSRTLIRWVFRRADFVSVRDKNSQRGLINMGILNPLLSGDRVEKADYFWQSKVLPKSYILVNALDIIDLRTQQRLKRIGRGKDIIFLAFQASDEKFLPSNWSGSFAFPSTKTQLLNLISNADLVIGERLHALLLGTKLLGREKVKLLRKPYAEKVQVFAKKFSWKIF